MSHLPSTIKTIDDSYYWEVVPDTSVELCRHAKLVRIRGTKERLRRISGRYYVSGNFYSWDELLRAVDANSFSPLADSNFSLTEYQQYYIVLSRFISSFTPEAIDKMTAKERLEGIKVFYTLMEKDSSRKKEGVGAVSIEDLGRIYADMKKDGSH
jgi:hypothetical protein